MDLQSPEKNDDKADSHWGITKVSSENIILLGVLMSKLEV